MWLLGNEFDLNSIDLQKNLKGGDKFHPYWGKFPLSEYYEN